jgi:hypothetical protein
MARKKAGKESSEPELPRVEPEIIPPDRTGRPDWRGSAWPPYAYSEARGSHRVYVTRLGPLGLTLLLAGVGVLAVAIFLTIVGAILIWIPVVALLVAAAAVYRMLRR